ncbi:L-2-hydroxyglutarate oxidase [uncultured Aeromicrobium sp.]|uniref:L-2-hydroxyglutarate oxidase n=1 Tax=uncultured Aeromicrobium sp. TaxID=337820 RepID=UPI0025DF4007|nr:L-2-hydroxyglutarate oxidase [uncultured Aeromicrobium sp.]
MKQRIAIVGGGILGAALARDLVHRHPGVEVVVMEKEDRLAAHQTGRNSGVVHAGLYYEPGSAKATLCRRGVDMLTRFCAEHGVTQVHCGKVLVALDEEDRSRLAAIERKATANGVPGVRVLNAEELREIEPHVAGIAGLHSPTTSIVDFAAVTRALAEDARSRGAKIRLSTEVVGIHERSDGATVVTTSGEERFDQVVLCAGLHADRLATLAGDDPEPFIVPFRGEYWQLREDRRGLVNGLVYPVPDPRYPFLGVHITPKVNGEVHIGPNAVLALAREGYGWGTVSVRDLVALARSKGFRRFARTHWRTGVFEVQGSLSKRKFVQRAQAYLPELTMSDVVPGPSGVRAQNLTDDGELVDDFRIHRRGRVLAVRNAPSPAATSGLAIAEHIVTTQLSEALT